MKQFANRRRPWLFAVAVFLVCAIATALAPAPRPVYAIDASLNFTPSNASGSGNAYRADASNMIFFAEAVERMYNKTPTTARVASADATLYGEGIRDGSTVTLPNSGGQWGLSFNQPSLRIQVVSGDEATTRARFDQIVSQLRTITADREAAAGVVGSAQVNLELVPPEPPVQYVNGSSSREKIAGILLGGLAAAAVFTVTARRSRRRRSAPVVLATA